MIARFVVRFLAVAAFLIFAQAANAQNTPPAPTANNILSQSQFANGGQAMANAVQSLLGDKSATTLADIIKFAKTANEDQRKAIAQGLAQAAKASAANGDPGFTGQIQTSVANSGLPELVKAYAEAAGDTATASTGGGGGGGGGGPTGSGTPNGGPNNGTGPGTNNFVPNQAIGFTGNSLSGGGFSSSTTTTTINQVSAF